MWILEKNVSFKHFVVTKQMLYFQKKKEQISFAYLIGLLKWKFIIPYWKRNKDSEQSIAFMVSWRKYPQKLFQYHISLENFHFIKSFSIKFHALKETVSWKLSPQKRVKIKENWRRTGKRHFISGHGTWHHISAVFRWWGCHTEWTRRVWKGIRSKIHYLVTSICVRSVIGINMTIWCVKITLLGTGNGDRIIKMA